MTLPAVERAAIQKLTEALEAVLVMYKGGAKPRKLDEALTWRQNDEKAMAMAEEALALAKQVPAALSPVGQEPPVMMDEPIAWLIQHGVTGGGDELTFDKDGKVHCGCPKIPLYSSLGPLVEGMHLPQYAKHIPSPERVAAAHSKVSADWFKLPSGRQVNHFPYAQQADEGCYLCALLYEIDNLKAQLASPVDSTDAEQAAKEILEELRIQDDNGLFLPEVAAIIRKHSAAPKK